MLPAWTTLPMTTVLMSEPSSPARDSVERTTMAPRSGAGVALRLPPKVPIAVRLALQRTISRWSMILLQVMSEGGRVSPVVPPDDELPLR